MSIERVTPRAEFMDALREMGFVLDETYEPVHGVGGDSMTIYRVFVPKDERNLGEKRPEDYDFIHRLWPDVPFKTFGPPQ